jgi:hypothetical protein
MRRSLLFALAIVLPLTGCTGTGDELDSLSAQLTAAIVRTCNFVPTSGTISALISAWSLDAGAAAAVMEQVADAVCKEVAPEGHALPRTETKEWVITAPNGKTVEIKGEFANQSPDPLPEDEPLPEPDNTPLPPV